jgi:pyruvate/2-oxoglutarate/acetoin dehydrogenase E1 component
MMSYRDALSAAMAMLASDPKFRAVGYGLLNGKGGNGTFKNVPNELIQETTVAENLMVGIAHGLALKGYRPMCLFERSDFIACGLSAISNHLDCAKEISHGQWNPCVIIRVVVGNRTKPLFTGRTHTQNAAPAMRSMLRMPVYEVTTPDEVREAYGRAAYEQRQGIGSSMIFEKRDLY